MVRRMPRQASAVTGPRPGRAWARHVHRHWYERARLVDLAGGDPDTEWAAAWRAGPVAIAGHIAGRASVRTEDPRW